LASPLTVAAPVDLLVAADVADTIHVAAAASLGGVVLALFVVAGPAARVRRWQTRAALAAATLLLVGLAACGGGEGSGLEAEPEPEVVVPPPAPVVVSYQLIATGVEATTIGASPTAIAVDALPVQGTVVSVTQ
jgi:hypothetical protein